MAYNDYTADYMNWASANPTQYNYSYGLVDPGMAQANASIANAWRGEDMKRNAEWANQQKMTDPAYWAQVFGTSGGGSVGKPVYEDTAGAYRSRLNSLMDNPDSIANTGAYKFAFGQGNEAINRNLAAKGLLKSGNRLTELTKFGQGLASQQYGAEMDRLSNLVSSTRSGDIAKYGADANLYGTELQGQNQLKALMMKNAMDMQKRYMAPGVHNIGGGTVYRWD